MTVTTPPAELRAAAARALNMGEPWRAHQLTQEAIDNASTVAFTPTVQSAITADRATLVTHLAASKVQPKKGHDGNTLSG
jgi:hypothetical protein